MISPASKVLINGRFQAHRPTGMQRYALAVSGRLGGLAECVTPPIALKGMAGHLWEQTMLPVSAASRVLWSPNNTGPIAHRRHIATIHDLIPLEHPEWFNPRFSGWYRWLMPRLARRLTHVIAVSEFTARRVQQLLGVPANRITVVPNGVDESYYPRPASEIEAVRNSLAVGAGPYLLYVGSLEPRKNLAGLMRAWSIALPKMPLDLTLIVAGAAGRGAVFAQSTLGQLPPRVKFTGYIPESDLPALYSGSLAVVYPSLYEGFGLPVLEAMAAGAPVITSSTTSLPEVGGGAAHYVDPADPHSIAAALEAVVSSDSLRSRMRAQGIDRARLFGWNRCAADTWRVLEAYV